MISKICEVEKKLSHIEEIMLKLEFLKAYTEKDVLILLQNSK